MSILVRKERESYAFTRIGKLAIIGFIVAFSSAIIDTIWAVYIDSFLNSVVLVGFFSAGLTLVSFVSYFAFIPLIEKKSKSKIYFFSLLLFAITYLLFAINTKLYIFIFLAFILTLIATFRITSFGIIVKDESSRKKLSRNEGLIYTSLNLAWVIGPLLAGYISEKSGINIVFLIAAFFVILAAITFRLSKIKDAHISKKAHPHLIKNFVEFFKDRKRVHSYLLSGGVNLWWILIYLFMPLYIIRNGLHTIWIGYFLFAVAVPLLLFEFLFANLAGKIGFKKIFAIGFLIPAALAITCFFISNVYVVLALLALASVGLAMLEPTTEAYFFDITKDEQRFYGPYNTTIELNQFTGKILSSFLLLLFPFKFVFLLFGAFMLIFVFMSFRIKEVIEKKIKI